MAPPASPTRPGELADELVRTISDDGSIAVRAMVGTGLVAEAVSRHRTSPTASVALGRALMGAVLLAAGAKDGETAQLHFRGDGPLGSVTQSPTTKAACAGSSPIREPIRPCATA